MAVDAEVGNHTKKILCIDFGKMHEKKAEKYPHALLTFSSVPFPESILLAVVKGKSSKLF